VKTWFLKTLLFQILNLYRYATSGLLERALQRLEWERSQEAAKKEADDSAEAERTVGLYKSNAVDP
jgi:hypothetical protein